MWIVGYDPPRPGGYEAGAEVGIWNDVRGRWQVSAGDEDTDVQVTHWMEVPDPPASSSDELPRLNALMAVDPFAVALALAMGYCPNCDADELHSASLEQVAGRGKEGVSCCACNWSIAYDTLRAAGAAHHELLVATQVGRAADVGSLRLFGDDRSTSKQSIELKLRVDAREVIAALERIKSHLEPLCDPTPIGYVAREVASGHVVRDFALPGQQHELAEGFEWMAVYVVARSEQRG
jgi:hypothetical protein